MITDLAKSGYKYFGEQGLPEDYPTPELGVNGLFYIQTNQNANTVIYEINRDGQGYICEHEPLHVYWKRYTDKGVLRELNTIQKQLAYGYYHQKICQNTYEICIVSYAQRKIYVDDKSKMGSVALMKINGKMAYLCNIYVYALEMGLFPDVKYIEFYGFDIASEVPVYEKVDL